MNQAATEPGHVFVIMGDVRHLACDVFLTSGDRALRAEGKWLRQNPGADARLDPDERADFQSERAFALPIRVADAESREATPIITAVPYYGVPAAEDLVPRLQHFFRFASAIILERGQVSFGERPLVAVPMFATEGGGGGPVRGDVLRVIYSEARTAVAHYGFDVALVLQDPRAYDLAQVIRRNSGDGWNALSPDHLRQAIELADDARRERLVPFMGSGVSVTAGAPKWVELIGLLAETAGLSEFDARALAGSYDVLDQAAYLRKEFERRSDDTHAFAHAVIDAVSMPRYGLAPALLASLEAEQAITLNYDTLFERAAEDAGLPRRVIPGPAAPTKRWLLKLHGTVDDPESIVLTRDQYLGFGADREALASLAKATLMTRRLLFVGFGMSDSHFHEIAHDVRRALPQSGRSGAAFGTVLTLRRSAVTERLWEGDLDFISFEDSPRQLDIFLDAVMAYARDGHSYLLADGYETTLPPDDAALRRAVDRMLGAINSDVRASPGWPILKAALEQLGWSP